ncbi:MAG: methyltransferase [Chloroflexi bacterium]|nr:methyltransferase [Chloroflexota bacterium]
MSKITRSQLKLHEQAEQLLWGSDTPLTHDEVAFCLEHWDPRALAGKHVAKNQAYFTPLPLAMDTALYVGGEGRRVVDIGAGIGRLAHGVLCANRWSTQVQVTAVELNAEYVKVGQRLLPEVTWVQADFYDQATWLALPQFDEAISNPPFGDVVTDCDTDWLGYRGPAGLMAAAIGLKVTRLGITMILPQTYTPYRFSGRVPGQNIMARTHLRALEQFMAKHPQMDWGHLSLDAEYPDYKGGWRGASPVVEIVALTDQDVERLTRPRPVTQRTAIAIPRPRLVGLET